MRRLFSRIAIFCILVSAVLAFSSPAAAQGDCPTPRLSIGGQGRITPGSSNRIRDAASTSGTQIGQIPPGGVFDVLEGSQCIDGFLWWRVNYEGIEGWTVEGNASGYFVEPVDANAPTETLAPVGDAQACPAGTAPEPNLVVGMWGRTSSNTTPSRVRSAPSVNAEQVGEIEPVDVFLVLDGPVCADGYNWWQIRTSIYHFLEVDPDAVQGWTAEGQNSDYFVEPIPATATPTASRTPLPSNTPGPTLTPSITPTASDTPTPTPIPLDAPTHVTWSADGKWLAISTQRNVLLYDTANLDVPLRTLNITGSVNDIIDILFSPTEPEILAVSEDFHAYLYDVAADQRIEEIPDTINTSDLSFSVDGHQLAVLTTEGVTIYDVEAHALTNKIDISYALYADAAVLSPDGKYVAVTDHSNYINLAIYSADGSDVYWLPQEYTGNILALAISPDSTKIATGDTLGNIRLWDITIDKTKPIGSALRPREDTAQSQYVNAITFSPDGKLIASAESQPQGFVRIFKRNELTPVNAFGLIDVGDTVATDLAYSPDGKYLAFSADNTVRILETHSYTQIAALIQSH